MKHNKKTSRKRVAKAEATTIPDFKATGTKETVTMDNSYFAPVVEPSLTCTTLALDDTTDPYFPYGGSQTRDLFLFHNPRSFDRLDALVLECGDLRDIARTYDAAKRKNGRADLNFVLSESHPEVLARNLLVLHAIGTPTDAAMPDLTRHIDQLTPKRSSKSIRKVTLASNPIVNSIVNDDEACFFLSNKDSRMKLAVNPTVLLAGPDGTLSFSAPAGLSPLSVICVNEDDIRGSLDRTIRDYVATLTEAFGPRSDAIQSPFSSRIEFMAGHPLAVMEKLVSYKFPSDQARWRTLKHHALPRGCTRKKYKHYYFAEHWFRLQHRGEDIFYAICNAIRDLWANGRPADPVFPFPFDVADGVPGNPDLADVSLSDDEDEDPLRAQDRELSYDSEPEAGTIEIDSDEEYLP
ncbi:hypothetical protein H9P43_006962 [Blastocladiella emersonii ATCC 22665]|nr:hypothetical protein H9P43_006962 [Blastocladiella emersonii ATCC 22665]